MTKKFFFATLSFFLSLSIEADSARPGKAFISSSDYTAVFKLGPFESIETGGRVTGSGALDSGFIKSSYKIDDALSVDIFAARSLDAKKISAESAARIVYSAFATVNRLAGHPPVSKISIYLVPEDRSFNITHRSWSIRRRYNVVYPIPVDSSGNYSRELVRNVSHELFHAWVGSRASSQFNNELGAVTMENCAELDAFGFTSQLDKSIISPERINALARPGSVVRATLDAKYGRDTWLDQLFIDKIIRKDEPPADLLESLCASRAKQALSPGMADERNP